MEELIIYIARRLVDHPEQIRVHQVRGRRGPSYKLDVAPDDKGQIIGKEGRIINAIRQLVDAAAAREGIHVSLDVA
ncbi:MAG: KH domain-containing protein [Chloroflexia bacterium]|nr:KH domain-containing protein [Chloroflexia bacterium]